MTEYDKLKNKHKNILTMIKFSPVSTDVSIETEFLFLSFCQPTSVMNNKWEKRKSVFIQSFWQQVSLEHVGNCVSGCLYFKIPIPFVAYTFSLRKNFLPRSVSNFSQLHDWEKRHWNPDRFAANSKRCKRGYHIYLQASQTGPKRQYLTDKEWRQKYLLV